MNKKEQDIAFLGTWRSPENSRGSVFFTGNTTIAQIHTVLLPREKKNYTAGLRAVTPGRAGIFRSSRIGTIPVAAVLCPEDKI